MNDEGLCKCQMCKRWFTPWEEEIGEMERKICPNCYEEGIDRAEEKRRGNYEDDYYDRFR